MSLVIRANTFFTKRVLKVDPDGVTHLESSFLGGRRKFRFHEIGCVLMSSQRVLSFQVGNEVFKVPTNPRNHRHQETIRALIGAVRTARGMAPVPHWPAEA
jgi:hypothetical protein